MTDPGPTRDPNVRTPTKTVPFGRGSDRLVAKRYAEPGQEATWQISDDRPGAEPLLTIVAANLEQGLADLEALAGQHRAIAEPHLVLADEADLHRGLVAALAGAIAEDPTIEPEPPEPDPGPRDKTIPGATRAHPNPQEP